MKYMINEKKVRQYCVEDISHIENYDRALTDRDRTWDCHHRLEVGANGEVVSREQLKRYGLYYHRPSSELIFLTHSEHMRLHKKGKPKSEEHRRKISESMKGKTKSEEHRRKIGESRKSCWEKKKMTEVQLTML